MLTNRTISTFASTLRSATAAGRHGSVKRFASTSSASSSRYQSYAWTTGATLSIGLIVRHLSFDYSLADVLQAFYLKRDRVRLDSQPDSIPDAVPDKVHSQIPDAVHGDFDDSESRHKGGELVSIRDVLDHKDGEEVWVVIRGDVYECVLPIKEQEARSDMDVLA